jgi:hypothetical protein
MKRTALHIAAMLIVCTALGQTNIISTSTAAEAVMLGSYDPALYAAGTVIGHPDSISRGVNKRVSPDSLKAYLVKLSSFKNRNTAADTVSQVTGMGAARTWIYQKFQQFSAQNGNRLLPSYLRFDQAICGMARHRNIFAVLPGSDTSDKAIVIIEAHVDSRCEDVCDTACVAHGMEDNGSGTALVMELARVMSRYTFKHTIVFIATMGEEQGLYGANAFATYTQQKGIKIKAVLNNDVIGGIICGKTSSAPSCKYPGHIDSTNVRLFSFAGINSPHKGLVRFIKLQYEEMIRPLATVPMSLHVMTQEDRSGRGGDHIPFRQKNYTSMRFTSANEHGDANVTSPAGYTDRQHTTSDILGVDTDSDAQIDSFFVDFNYLARNAVINGNAAGMAAIGPKTVDFSFTSPDGNDMIITVTDPKQYLHYRAGLRTTTFDWDTLITWTGALSHTFQLPAGTYIASVGSVDQDGVESLFPKEVLLTVNTGLEDATGGNGLLLLQNEPNPADEATIITVVTDPGYASGRAFIHISDVTGREVRRMPVDLKPGVNEVTYDHGYNASGVFLYSLVIDGKTVATRRMVFSN